MSLRILILDAYTESGRAALQAAGASDAGALYRRLLAKLEPTAELDVAAFKATGFDLPAAIDQYDGIVWTGSNLTVHRDNASVRSQLELVRRAFDAGVPSFGSCWAVHIAVTATGGRCEANPRGREFGVARRIILEGRGRAHPMFAEKPAVFDGYASHEDHVVQLGPAAELLASNAFSPVQAVVVSSGRGVFWAVQYHPEYAPNDIADLGALRAAQLIEQGFFRGPEDAASYMEELRALGRDEEVQRACFRLGVGRDLLEMETRTREVKNWLERLVKARA